MFTGCICVHIWTFVFVFYLFISGLQVKCTTILYVFFLSPLIKFIVDLWNITLITSLTATFREDPCQISISVSLPQHISPIEAFSGVFQGLPPLRVKSEVKCVSQWVQVGFIDQLLRPLASCPLQALGSMLLCLLAPHWQALLSWDINR